MRFLILLLLPFAAYGSSSHDHTTTINHFKQDGGVALAIAAAQHSFDWGSYDLQGSVAVGSYGSADALSLGIAKRFNRVLINGSIGAENGETGYGAAVNFRF